MGSGRLHHPLLVPVTAAVPCAAALAAAVCLCGCSAETESPTKVGGVGGGGTESCLAPNRLVNGECREPGVQDDGCLAGTGLVPDGSCQPAGIPPEMCAEGFEPTDERGCEPILPAQPCPAGLMALPGETECREVMACGAGPWGDIPVDATTVYVDQSYDLGAGPSDGTESRPYTTVGEAVAAAPADTLIAIAAGSYVEAVLIEGKALRIWGKCPAEVELVGPDGSFAAVHVGEGASGTGLTGLAIRGSGVGFFASGAENLQLHGLWVHDNAERGMAIQDSSGPTTGTLSSSLIERNGTVGVFVSGAEVQVEGIVARDNLPRASDGNFGGGINVADNYETGLPSSVSLRGSLVDGNRVVGVFLGGSDVVIEGSVIRGTLPRESNQTCGHGLDLRVDPLTGTGASLLLRTTLIHHNHEIGVIIEGAHAELEAVEVRDTLPQVSDQTGGRGISFQADSETGERARGSVRASLVGHNREVGVFVAGSDAVLDRIAVLGTLPEAASELAGRGVNAQCDPSTFDRASVLLRACIIEGNHDAGVAVIEADAQLLGVRVADTSERPVDGLFGDGVMVLSAFKNTMAELSGCHIGQSIRAGVGVFATAASLRATSLSCNAIQLATETYDGRNAEVVDRGYNHCSCGEEDQLCTALSAGLEAPEPVGIRE